MHPDSGQTTSTWIDAASAPSYPALTDSADTGICIVGAGIAGLTTAYLLATQGQKVIVIDDGQIGSGETSRTTAHLSNEIDDRYVEIARVHGDNDARIAANSHTAEILVVCTNSPINDLMAMHTKQAPYRTYAIAARVPRGSVTDALYWDTEDPYHYVRLQSTASDGAHDELIVGGEDHKTGQQRDMQPWAKLYDPSRISINYGALKEFVKENANVGVMYTEWLRPLNGESPDELSRGEGKITRRKTQPIALYRDERGVLHEMSAVCPHLTCIVHWNTLEKSWDCPCHGSRFDAYGKVLTGPAVSSLERWWPRRNRHAARNLIYVLGYGHRCDARANGRDCVYRWPPEVTP